MSDENDEQAKAQRERATQFVCVVIACVFFMIAGGAAGDGVQGIGPTILCCSIALALCLYRPVK